MPRRFSSGSSSYETVFDYSGRKQELTAIEKTMSEPGFWDHPDQARQTVSRLKNVKSLLVPLEEIVTEGEELEVFIDLADEDGSHEAELVGELEKLERRLEDLEVRSLLDGPHDHTNAILNIHARDGGTDANDWAEMLLRMYIQWAQKYGYSVKLLDRNDNEEAGINSATIAIAGPMAYGYLKGEEGIHRLVRISPFNAEGKRQTSFAAIDVSPDVEDDEQIEIDDQEVRIDTYRASGAGGQHVNKTDSAIRLTHEPTGIVVQCQNERSQHKNRAAAWKMLRARLARLKDEQREAEQAQKYRDKARVGFGSQIRNYFLHPDQRVKDARTGYSMGNFHAVLDGDLQGFLDAFLRWRVNQDVESN